MDLLTKPLRGRGTSPVLFRARSSLSEGSHQPLLTLNPLVVEETSDFSCLAQCGERRLLLRADSHRVRASRGKATRWRGVDWRWWLPLWQCPLPCSSSSGRARGATQEASVSTDASEPRRTLQYSPVPLSSLNTSPPPLCRHCSPLPGLMTLVRTGWAAKTLIILSEQ